MAKQRKYRLFAPLHKKAEKLSAHLSSELKEKYGTRSLRLRKGDTVRISRGQFKKKTGKVEELDIRSGKVFVAGIENTRKDGSKSFYSLEPSNLIIIETKIEDAKRKKGLDRLQPRKSAAVKTEKPAKNAKVKA